MLTLSGAGQPQNGGAGIEERFVISVKTDNYGTSLDNEFTLPWLGTYDVDWGDGISDTGVVDTQTHTYATAGTYDVAVTATAGQIYFARANNDRKKLLDIKNWGTCAWTTMSRAFQGCEKLEGVSAMDIPNFTNCTDTSGMFGLSAYSTPAKITNLINWDVSNITNMTGMFEGYKRYSTTDLTEGTINFSNWDFSNVTKMRAFCSNSKTIYGILDCTNTSITNLTDGYQCLRSVNVSNIGSLTVGNTFPGGAKLVDATLSNLDISNTTNFYTAFAANNFPSGITFDSWDFSHVTSTRDMFPDCTNIPDVTGLDVSSVSNFQYMFSRSSDFNQDISVWDVSGPGSMRGMLYGTTNFDRSLANWDISGITDFRDFMKSAGISTANYDSTLIGWLQSLENTYPGGVNYPFSINISFGSSRYTLGGAAETARNTLINTYGWTITDGGGIFVGLLDTYSGAAAAYSLRDLASASVGSAVVRVRRSNDNTEQDFTAEEITDGTLTTFTGANDGFVTTWYDQSDNGLDVSNSTATNQPSIVLSGVLNTLGGKPTINVNGNKFLVAADVSKSTLAFAHQNEATITCVTNFDQNGIWAGTSSAAYGNQDNIGFEIGYRIWGGVLTVRNGVVHQASSVTLGYNFWYFELDCDNSVAGDRGRIYTNNILTSTPANTQSSTPSSNVSDRPFAFFGKSFGTPNPTGDFSEFIIWDNLKDQSSRNDISNNINTEYSIY